MNGLRIEGTGHFVPEKIITNEYLSTIVETSDEWITERTGMKERHFCSETETNVFLSTKAAEKAIENAGINKDDIGVVIVATFSPDNFVPSTACLLQKELGLSEDIIAFDLNAACSGFIFGMQTVIGLMLTGKKKYALLVGSEVISRKLDMTDRGTCILFGDGAAAAVLSLSEEPAYIVTGCRSDSEMIYCPAGKDTPEKIIMNGQGTYKFAVRAVPSLINKLLTEANVNAGDVDCYILHQANRRIIEAVAKQLCVPIDRFFINIEKYGNTSAASIPIALSEAVDEGVVKRGSKVLLAGFGAGKTWGGAVFTY